MANTLISYLNKIQDGAIFRETFENDNFITAESWLTTQGTPATSMVSSFSGAKSWDNSVPGLPAAKKQINNPLLAGSWMYSVWFFDVVGNTTAQGPYVKIQTSDGKFYQVGVRNGVSTTKYSF